MRRSYLGARTALVVIAVLGLASTSCSTDDQKSAEPRAAPSAAAPAVEDTTAPPVPAPSSPTAPASESNREPDPFLKSHYLFVGTASPEARLDCEIFETSAAPHRRPPRDGLHDATDYPERHQVGITIHEVLQNPSNVGLEDYEALSHTKGTPTARVAFALGPTAFHAPEANRDPTLYKKQWCEHLNRWFSSKYIVVHAYPIHVDRGNSAPSPWRRTWESIGTDPGKRNGGFDTLEEARAYARRMLTLDEDGEP